MTLDAVFQHKFKELRGEERFLTNKEYCESETITEDSARKLFDFALARNVQIHQSAYEAAKKFVEKYPNMFTEDKDFWISELERVLVEFVKQ